MMEEKQVKIGDHLINYAEAGSGEPMIFLHNGGGFWQTWIKQLNHFSASHRVIGIDWPGFGESSEIEVPFTLELLVETLDQFIQKLELESVILVGNCVGGSAALIYALRNKERVKKLVIFNICPGKDIYRKAFYARLIKGLNNYPRMRKWVSSFLGFLFTRTFIRKKFPAVLFSDQISTDDFLFQKYVQKFKQDRQTRARINMVFAVHTFTLAEVLKHENGTFPFALIWGSENKVTPFKTHGLYHKELLKAENFTVLSGGSHLCMYEKPEDTIELIEQELKHVSHE